MSFSRRALFGRGLSEAFADFITAAAPPTDAPPKVERPPFLRPPGAVDEASFLARCTSCTDCIDACPRDAIRHATDEFGSTAKGTPVIVPEEQPCWLCTDLPCIPACTTDALLPLAESADARLGTIRVDTGRCFAAQGNICDVCAERCPVRPKPVYVPMGSAPEVDVDRCAGCGVCAWLCPADAIEVFGNPTS
jgi:ferredoxin-type protein NapG